FLFTIAAQANSDIDSLVDDLGVLANLEHNAVHPDNQIDWFQGTVLPRNYIAGYFFGDPGYGRGGYIKVIDFTYLLLDIAVAHSLGVERDDDVFDAIDHIASFGDDHWIKRGLPIPGNGDLGFTKGCFYFFLGVSVANILTGGLLMLVVIKVAIELTFEHLFNPTLLDLL